MRKTALAIIALFALGSLTASASAQPPGYSSAGEALDNWEGLGQNAAYHNVLTHAEAVRTLASKDDQSVVSRLVRIAENKAQELDSRKHAALVATQVADAASAETVVAWVKDTWTELTQAEANTDFADRETVLRDNRYLINSFIMKGAKNLLDDLQDHTFIATLAKETSLWACVFPGDARRLKSEADRLLARCKVPEAFRDEAIVQVLLCDDRGSHEFAEILVELLGERGRDKLVEVVRSGVPWGDRPYTAEAALTYLGDERILPDLRALQAAMSDASEAKRAQMLNFIWRIEVQHPPQKLLDYIASTERRGYRVPRSWAVRRAVRLGVEPARVREAILTHERNAPSTKMGRVQLIGLKRVGLELDILHENDLPDVVLRDRRPKP
ncbi:MAG: hypothetical protein JSU86_17760 [Phycisphaerales bacterium]|nr:MAG: hypothetical protein JSU86_17760 [Phycisphaerales bacterium]